MDSWIFYVNTNSEVSQQKILAREVDPACGEQFGPWARPKDELVDGHAIEIGEPHQVTRRGTARATLDHRQHGYGAINRFCDIGLKPAAFVAHFSNLRAKHFGDLAVKIFAVCSHA